MEKVLGPQSKIVNKKESYVIIQDKILRANITAEVLEEIGMKEKISYIGGEH